MFSGSAIHIAYAEKQVLVRKGVIALLSTCDELVFSIEADDGAGLLDRLSLADRLPDICIIGVRMSPMNGHDTLLELKNRWPAIRVLVLTGNDNPKITMRMIAAGANGYLHKSSSPEIIVKALHDIHVNEYYYGNEATKRIFKQINDNAIKAPRFSQPELDVISYAGTNLSYEAISRVLKTSERSVRGCVTRIFEKLEISSRAELALFAFQSGLANREEDNGDIT